MQITNLLADRVHFRGFVKPKTNTKANVFILSDLTWNTKYSSLSGPQRNLSFSSLIFFPCSLVSSHNLLIFRSKWRCPETKWFKELFYRVDSICPLCQTNTLQFEREQSNGNGNLSSLKIFPSRACECSAKMCDSVFHCDCTEGILASVIHCLHSYCAWCLRLLTEQ